MPRAWQKSEIIFISKPGESYFGRVDELCLITLLKVPQKIFMKINTNRILFILYETKILADTSISISRGTSTHSSLLRFHTAVEASKSTKSELFMMMDVKSKAFNNSSFELVYFALKRVGLCSNFVKFYKNNCLKNCQISIAMEFGSTKTFAPNKGIPHRASESALFFVLCYYIVLSALSICEKPLRTQFYYQIFFLL